MGPVTASPRGEGEGRGDAATRAIILFNTNGENQAYAITREGLGPTYLPVPPCPRGNSCFDVLYRGGRMWGGQDHGTPLFVPPDHHIAEVAYVSDE